MAGRISLAPLAHIPRSALAIMREVGRHILHRPVVGVLAVACDEEGRFLLIRRADTGTWCMPGGTVDWGETVREAIIREVREETGARVLSVGELVGVYGRPDRDLRFHAVTIVVKVLVDASRLGVSNPLEIREARLFEQDCIPRELAMGTSDMLRDGIAGRVGVVE